MRFRGGWVVAALVALVSLAAAVAPVGVGAQTPERLAGSNRFATAAAVSAATFAPGVAVAYVATGENFPDALAGGPLAGSHEAPILLAGRDALPAETLAELGRLQPDEIVVLGGAASVSDAVVAALEAVAPVRRIAGASRFGTAAAVSAEGFDPGVDNVYVATGANFPDALAGGAAGAATGSPVLLVNANSIPPDTRAELERLQPGAITVLGGAGVVNDAVLTELAGLTTGEVRRLAGDNRFATAAAIADDVYPDGAPVVFLATGANFPDALAGGPVAGLAGGPLLLVNADCAPAETVAAVGRLEPDRIVVLGGAPVVSDAAAALTPCATGQLPPPTFALDASLQPTVPEFPGLQPGDPPRPVARLADTVGGGVDFIESELLVQAPSGPELDAVLTRYGGTLLETYSTTLSDIDPVHLVRIDPATGDPGGLTAAAMQLQPGSTGAHGVSSDAGLGTLAASLEASADGMVVGLNALPAGDTFLSGSTQEDATMPATAPPAGLTWNRDAFQWEYMRASSPMAMGIADAWQVLAQAGGPLGGPVQIAIIDGGFGATDADRPANAVTLGTNFGNANLGNCGINPGPPPTPILCPWHGHNTASAAAAVADNGTGAAGAAGPGVRVVLSDTGGASVGVVQAILDAADQGARIFNMSFGWSVPQATANTLDPVLRIINGLWLHHNRTFFASAGNAGTNVDNANCGPTGCVETTLTAPCEWDLEVVCVGGVTTNTQNRHPNSNFGPSVDIFGPFTAFVGPDPSNATVRSVNGTSFSSPIVAGVAALMWEAFLDQPPFDNPGNNEIARALIETANPSPDPNVTRVLNAVGAIRRALGGTGGGDAPTVQLVNPTGDITVDYGVNRTFEATASDPQDGTNCCTLRWTSDVDGLMSVGRQFFYAFPTVGMRTVTVVATDGNGNTSAPVTFRVNVVNAPPVLTVDRPVEGEVLFQDVGYTFRAAVSDPNEPNFSCNPTSGSAGLVWTSAGSASATGCRPRMRLSVLGAQTVTATITDATGVSTIVTRNVTVQAIPPNSPPIVQIHSPDPGADLKLGEQIRVEGEATLEPGEVTPVTYSWTYTRPGSVTVISTATAFNFLCVNNGPAGSIQDQSLTFTAQDNDGSASETVNFTCERPLT